MLDSMHPEEHGCDSGTGLESACAGTTVLSISAGASEISWLQVMHGSFAESGKSPAAEAEVLPAHAVLLVEGRQLNDELLLFQVSICSPLWGLLCMTSATRLKLCCQCSLHRMWWMGLTVYKQTCAFGMARELSEQGVRSLGHVSSVPASTGSILRVQVCSCSCAEALCTCPCRAWSMSSSLRT